MLSNLLLILIVLGILTVYIMGYIGLGFLTDSVFKDKKPSEYDNIYRRFMKMFVVISWITLALSIFTIKNQIIYVSKN